MEEVIEKVVLVMLGDHTRMVKYRVNSSCAEDSELQRLTDAIQERFNDVLSRDDKFFIQVKNEDWGGVFIDYDGSSQIDDKSVVRVVCTVSKVSFVQ